MTRKNDHTPLISVILPVYNAGKHLSAAIESVLNQSFTDFELIIINDGSTDGSVGVIQSYNDPRIVFIDQTNMGLAATLNKAIGMARGTFIARQDNDDISDIQRFEKQVMFLNQNPEVSLLGTAASIVDENGKSTGRYHDHPLTNIRIKFALIFDNPFVHSSVMIRASVLAKTGLYDVDTGLFEDYNLWSRIARIASVANLADRLVNYKEVNTGMSKSASDYRQRVKRQAAQNIRHYCTAMTDPEIDSFLKMLLNLEYQEGYRKTIGLVKKHIQQIKSGFCSVEGANSGEIEHEARMLVLRFRRGYYSLVLASKKVGVLLKLWAMVSRRVMFLTYKNQLMS